MHYCESQQPAQVSGSRRKSACLAVHHTRIHTQVTDASSLVTEVGLQPTVASSLLLTNCVDEEK